MWAMHRSLEPGRIGGLKLRNRIIKTATYEGLSPGGRVTDGLVCHHADMARQGVGLTTVAYGAVSAEPLEQPIAYSHKLHAGDDEGE